MKQLHYPNSPIGSVSALARIFSRDEDKLIEIANKADNFYVANSPEIKPNGKIRQTYRVMEPLKRIQGRILLSLLKTVEIPDYLQGGIIGRDYVGDASLHAGKMVVVKEDVSDFFPSVRSSLVTQMWKGLFHFPKSVAEILTKLTTYKGSLPQGASTSTYIGNMVFWDLEPKMESTLREKGFTYSRFVDDISVSSDYTATKQETQRITSFIYSMLRKKGLQPNRTKRAVMISKSAMQVHGLNLNSGRTTLPKAERAKIRAAVNQLENRVQSTFSWNEINDQFAVVQGRLGVMAKLHPEEAKKYKDRLRLLKNRFNDSNE